MDEKACTHDSGSLWSPSFKMQPFCVVGGECKGSSQMRLKITSDWLLKMKPDTTVRSVRSSYRQERRKRTRNKLARREPDSSQGKKKRIKEEVKKENTSSRCIETQT